MLRSMSAAMLLLALILASPVSAGEVRLRLLSSNLDAPVDRRIQLDPIGLRDLGLAGPALDAGSNAGTAQRSGAGLTFSPGQVPIASVDLHVRRQVPLRWQLDLPLDRRLDPPRVRVACEGMDGHPGTLTHGSGGERLPVRVETGSTRTVAREDSREILEGEVWLELDLGLIRYAGRYQGRIVVDLEYL